MKLREAPAGDDRNSGFSAAEPAGKGAVGARGVAGFFYALRVRAVPECACFL